jgi:regulator of protease activity HflC (stomatin/prohibitin superfamily)
MSWPPNRRRGRRLALTVWGWIGLTALVVYAAATVLASIKRVPSGRIGVRMGPGARKEVLSEGLHLVQPFGTKVVYIPRGPERIMGDVRDIVTKDGWRLTAVVQLSATVYDERSAALATEDWRREALKAALASVRLLLERSDAADLRPSPHALDEGARDETDHLLGQFGTKVEWLRVTVKWPQAIPPAHVPASGSLRYEIGA